MMMPDRIDVGAMLARNYWVFDMDGTLTLPVHDFAAIRAALGVPDGVDILGFLSSLPAELSQPLHDKLQVIEEGLAVKTAAAPGVVPLIEYLHRRGARLGILTRNTRENALRTLEAIGVRRYFPPPFIIGRADASPKPDPDGVHKLAALWGADARDMVMVGDYLYDLQTGRAAGAATIHVDRTGTFRWPELTDLGVGALDELLGSFDQGGQSRPA